MKKDDAGPPAKQSSRIDFDLVSALTLTLRCPFYLLFCDRFRKPWIGELFSTNEYVAAPFFLSVPATKSTVVAQTRLCGSLLRCVCSSSGKCGGCTPNRLTSCFVFRDYVTQTGKLHPLVFVFFSLLLYHIINVRDGERHLDRFVPPIHWGQGRVLAKQVQQELLTFHLEAWFRGIIAYVERSLAKGLMMFALALEGVLWLVFSEG